MERSAPVCSQERVSEILENFAFRRETIYSHKDKTVFVNRNNFSSLDEIIDYELRTQEVQENGFMVIRFGSDIVPLMTDGTVAHFLTVSGDDKKCRQKVKPSHLNLVNMKKLSSGGMKSIGMFCSKEQLAKIHENNRKRKGGNLDASLIELKANDMENDKSAGKQVASQNPNQASESSFEKQTLKSLPPPIKKSKFGIGNESDSNLVTAGRVLRSGRVSITSSTNSTALMSCLEEAIMDNQETEEGHNHVMFKFRVMDHEDDANLKIEDFEDGVFSPRISICPCGGQLETCRAVEVEAKRVFEDTSEYYQPDGRDAASLLHEAFHHQQRLQKIMKTREKKNSSNKSEGNRHEDDHLRVFETVLCHMLESSSYFYNFLQYKGCMNIESHEGLPSTSVTHYDMGKHKNLIEDCVNGYLQDELCYPLTYTGFSGSLFTTTNEDLYGLNRMNLMLYGGAKVWIFVAPNHQHKLVAKSVDYMNKTLVDKHFSPCILEHKHCFVHPGLLDLWKIPYKVFVQRPGDLVISAAGSFHWGMNLTVNVNYEKNVIYSDYRLRMLNGIFNPFADTLQCNVNCHQRVRGRLNWEQDHKFLRIFYQSILKGSKPIVYAMIKNYYDKCHDLESTVSTVRDKINVHLKKFKKEYEKLLSCSATRVEKVLTKLKTDVITRQRIALTISRFTVGDSQANIHWFPKLAKKLTTSQEDVIFNKVPYTHIMMQHDAYTDWSEACSISTGNIEKDGVVTRYFQSYKQVVDYWAELQPDVDYKKVSTEVEETSSDTSVETLTDDASDEMTNIDNKQNSSEVFNTNVGETALQIPFVSHTDQIENVKPLKMFFRNLESSSNGMIQRQDITDPLTRVGELMLYEMNNHYYFVCNICYKDLQAHLRKAKTIHKEMKLTTPLPQHLEHIMKKKNGVFSDIGNLRHHLSQSSSVYKCSYCAPRFKKQTFKTKYSIINHVRYAHQNHFLFCPLCNKKFNQPAKLRRHWSSAENACIYVDLMFGKKNDVKVEKCKCSKCDFQFTKIEEWRSHIKGSTLCRLQLDLNDCT